MIDMMKKIVFIVILFCLSAAGNLPAEENKRYFENGCLGMEAGIWKPASIDDEPSNPFQNVEGAKAYCGLSFVSPSFAGFSLRATLIQWQQRDEILHPLESITLRHLTIDLKNQIVAQARLSPYVCYGLAAIWSRERRAGAEDEKAPLDRAGFGGNVGAGIDVQVFKHWGISAEYLYLYAKFEKKVGLTDNYSGPKLSCKLMYLF